MDREQLYQRIEQRVDNMLRQGLVEEVKALLDRGCTDKLISMQALGYKEIIASINGEYSLKQAIDTIKLNSRHFAKRQLTWFRREKEIIWYDIGNYKNIIELSEKICLDWQGYLNKSRKEY